MSKQKEIKTRRKNDKESLQERIKALEVEAAKEIVDQMFVIMDGIEGAIYVADMETYELLHVNSYIRKHFGNDLVGKKCYKVLHDRQDRPCALCTNKQLLTNGKPGPPLIRDYFNSRTGFWYQYSDRAIMNVKFLAFCFVLCTSILLCWIVCPEKANSGPYLDSAHGNTSYGVDRRGLASFSYSVGNCVHCHEQHASIGGTEQPPTGPTGGAQEYELFRTLFVDQSSMFCFDCHKGTGSSLQASMPSQYSYSYVRGGATTLTCPSDIMTAFQYEDATGVSNPVNPCPSILTFGSSAHTLSTIQNYLVNKVGFGPTQANINPCSGCHDPHRAQRNYPVSRPGTHTSLLTWELWGDDDNSTERAPVAVKVPPATNGYMSPYKVGGVSYEEDTFPAGTYRTTRFELICRDCHDASPPAGLADVSWATAYHGGATSSTTLYGGLKAPYSTAASTTYTLNCTDCHEPHGSRNEYLLRWEVNGVTDIRIADSTGTYQSGHWYNFCTACHTYDNSLPAHDQMGADPRDIKCNQGMGCHGHAFAGIGF